MRFRDPKSLGRMYVMGLCLGSGIQILLGAPNKAMETNASNIVPLRSEKMVTLQKTGEDLSGLLKSCETQTALKFSADRDVLGPETYDVMLRTVPINRVLLATSYLTGGVWERAGRTYRLRRPKADEIAISPELYSGDLERVSDYLSHLDPKDPSVSPAQAAQLSSFQAAMEKRPMNLPTNLQGLTVSVAGETVVVNVPNGTGGARGIAWSFQ